MTSVKDEAPYLLEWIAHHKAVGFDSIFITANDSSDGTFKLLQELKKHSFVQYCKNVVAPGCIPQHEGYNTLRNRFGVDDCDWLMILDIDEFLNVNFDGGQIGSLTQCASEETDIIAINALTFGSGRLPEGHQLVTQRFKMRLPDRHPINGSVKTITRNPARFSGAHNHHLVGLRKRSDLSVMTAGGRVFKIDAGVPLWKVLRHFEVDSIDHSLAYYNHYAIKSKEEFLLRQQRGRGAVPTNSLEIRHNQYYFDERAAASVFDERVLRYRLETLKNIEVMTGTGSIGDIHEKVLGKFKKSLESVSLASSGSRTR